MQIPCTQIAEELMDILRSDVMELRDEGNTPKLVTILAGSSPEQLSFVNIKKRIAFDIGVEFELVHLSDIPSFEEFKKIVQKKAHEQSTSGMIIQHPFPESYSIDEIYELIPPEKEIEGFHPDSTFHFPLSLAVLNGLKYVFMHKNNDNDLVSTQDTIVDFNKDAPYFQEKLKSKHVVIAGRGLTGGAPIAKALTDCGVKFQITHSQTVNSNEIYKAADIIITATGKKIVSAQDIKDGVVLLNVGLRKENGKLRGDYEEDEIRDKAAYFTKTPGGLGPLDVLYLFKNVIEAERSRNL